MPTKTTRPRRNPPRHNPPTPTGSNRLILIAGALLLAVLALLAFTSNIFSGPNPPPQPITPPSTGRIAFVRKPLADNALRSLYIVNADGTNQQQITNSVDVDGTIAWSPTANSIILQATIDKISTIVRADISLDNKLTTSAQLTADLQADSASPAWSPDGSMLAFMSKANSAAFQIYVMNADGSNKRRLTTGDTFAGFPTWSPDGQTILYLAGDNTTGAARELFTISLNNSGEAPTRLTTLNAALNSPQWSPDGKLISFIQTSSSGTELLILANSDGSNIQTLDEARSIFKAQFSPSGTFILYDTVTDSGANLKLYDLTTQQTTPIAATGDNYSPTWSPDSSMIAWAGTSGNQPHKIVIADKTGANPQTVSSGEGSDYYPHWQLPK